MDSGQVFRRVKSFVETHRPPLLAEGAMLPAAALRTLGRTPQSLFLPASESQIAKVEGDLGFHIPPLIASVLCSISNGIAGFSYDLIGVGKGCTSQFGDLLQTYLVLKDEGLESADWPNGLLPFCDWGCLTFSCVDCMDEHFRIGTLHGSLLRRHDYSLADFFSMFVDGVDILSVDSAYLTKEIHNPFTGTWAEIKVRKRPDSH